MEPSVLSYARPDPPRPRSTNRLLYFGLAVWLVGWVTNLIGTALDQGRRGPAANVSVIGFDLVIIAFVITLFAAVLGPQGPLKFIIAVLEISTCCVTIRH